MTVTIQYRLSGGASNTDPNAALGGAMSSTAVSGTALNNLFDDVTSAQASAGLTEYRCIYVRNGGSSTAIGARIWVSSDTTSSTTAIAIALGGEGNGGTAETVGSETTAPTGESFSSPSTAGTGLSLGNLAASEFFPVWIRRTVNAATSAVASDPFEIRVDYDFIP
jgi:hypothetical protein